MTGHVATARTEISASPAQVWSALTDPAKIEKYFFGSKVETTWQPGDPIRWKGEYDGNAYEDKGEVVEAEPESRLVVTHFSPLTGLDDKSENYHTLTYELTDAGDKTQVALSQDNNASPEEAERSQANWETMLANLKEYVERG